MHTRISPILFVILFVALPAALPARARAQADARAAIADRWLDAAVQREQSFDRIGRHVVGVGASLLGTALLVTPLMTDWRTPSRVMFMSAGGAMLMTATTAWAISDAYDAQHWSGASWELSLALFGGGLMTAALQNDFHDPPHSISRELAFTLGALEVGFNVSALVVRLIAPVPSASALASALGNASPEERFTRIHAYLVQRDRTRLVAACATLPWGIAASIGVLSFAHDAATSGGRVLAYGLAGATAALSVAGLVYELVRTRDWQRLDAGEPPK